MNCGLQISDCGLTRDKSPGPIRSADALFAVIRFHQSGVQYQESAIRNPQSAIS
jgi:hypothetical protein